MGNDNEIFEKLSGIARKFSVFQCQECADEIQIWLKECNINGVYLKLRSAGGDFIISERVGGDIAISQNGIHCGVEVYGRVFDNLPSTGMMKQTWLNDFACLGGFTVIEIPF